MELTQEQKEQVLDIIKNTPGKADDFLQSAACFSGRMSTVCTYAKDNYVDADGTFQDIKLSELDKWLPIVRYVLGQAQSISEECFESNLVPKVESEIIRLIFSWLGLKVGNE